MEEKKDYARDQAIAQYKSICEMVSALQDNENEDEIEKSREEIHNDPLEVAYDKGERFDGTKHYMILLCTGGPAVRVTGELDLKMNMPETATLQYQDWGTPWTDYREADKDVLLVYASEFYFGE